MTDTNFISAVPASKASHVPDLRLGQRVVELGGDGSILVIASFERGRRNDYSVRCLKLYTDEIVTLPVTAIKPAEQHTIH